MTETLTRPDTTILKVSSRPLFYHGSWQVTRDVSRASTDGPGMGMMLSSSVNVARRYGPLISCFELQDCSVACTSVDGFYEHASELEGLAPAILVKGERERYDVPVDLLRVFDTDILAFSRVLRSEELVMLDDGLPVLEKPMGPADRGWDLWVSQMQAGDLNGALQDLGWFADNDLYVCGLPAEWDCREWLAKVYQLDGPAPLKFTGNPSSSWIVDTNYGETASCVTLNEALELADRWLRQHQQDRNTQRLPGPVRRQADEDDDSQDVPF